MIRLIVILLFFVIGVAAQDMSITDFSGGLNTESSVLLMKSGQARICLNFDIWRGHLSKRKGYVALLPTGEWPSGDTIAGDDPTIGLYAFRRSDGQRRLLGIVSDSDNTSDLDGLGWMVASPGYDQIPAGSGSYYYFKEGALWRYYKYIYTGATPFWTYWKDRAYFSNGRQRPIVFYPYRFEGSDGYARELVPLTPGEPLIVPMNVSGNLDGQYYYMISHSGSCGEAVDDNEAVNSDFENWTNYQPDDWDTSDVTGYIFEETDSIKNGSSAMKLVSHGSSNPFNDVASQVFQTVRANADSTYLVEVWYNRITNNGSKFEVYAADTVGGDYIAGVTNYYGNEIYDAPDKGYCKMAFYFNRDADRDSAEIYIETSGGANDTVYVDSVTVKQARVNRFGVVTKPVVAQNENVMLTRFPWQTLAAGCAYDDEGYNALTIDIYRCKANPGKIDYDDKFYKLASIALTDTAQIDTLHYVDTIPDDTLGYSGFNVFITMDSIELGRDSSGILSGVRVGAPTYIDRKDGVHDVGHIFLTSVADADTVYKTSYICTYYDSLIDAESDSSRSLHIFRDIAKDSVYKLGLPGLPGGMRHLTRKLYKSYSYIIQVPEDSVTGIKDTSITVRYISSIDGGLTDWKEKTLEPLLEIAAILDNNIEIYTHPPVGWNEENKGKTVTHDIKYYQVTASPDSVPDTIATAYKLIAEIKSSDTIFTDTIGWDSFQRGKQYFKSAAPFSLNGVKAFDDRLWGYTGASVYWSYLDTGGLWGSYRSISLNADDGDVVTAIIPFRDYVKVYKNYSQYIVYPGAELEYERRWTVDGVGCIAPHTAIAHENGIFYLSHKGLIRESGSVYRDRGSDYGIVSLPINNLLMDRDRDELSEAIGFVYDNKYRLSLPDANTTFVYDLITGGWAIYDYAFKQAALYDTTTENAFVTAPSGDMVFITGEDDQLYKADTTDTDNGTTITTHWRSAPFCLSPDYVTVEKVGVWRESNDESGGIDVRFYDMEGDSVCYLYVDDIDSRYDVYGFQTDVSGYFQIDIQDTTLDSLAIDRIDLWYRSARARSVK